MQQVNGIKPHNLNLDTAYSDLKEDESPYLKDFTDDINTNPNTGYGSNNPLQEGQNLLSLTPCRSNIPIKTEGLPAGYNKTVGSFYCINTRDLYQFNYNDQGNHGIYVTAGDTLIWTTVIVDPALNFSDDQDAYIADHRVRMRLVFDSAGNIIEKILVFTDGNNWQFWLLTMTAIQTDGFNAILYPYFTLLQPHFDRKELLQWASRPCMYNPLAVAIPNTSEDVGKVNRVVDQAWQFSQVLNYTDGRPTTNSPYSLPVIIKSEDFSNNPDTLSKNILVTMYAGSCLVESIDIYVRSTYKNLGGAASSVSWGDWYKYLRIYKFPDSETSSGDVLATQYWLRTGAWSGLNYDPLQNTIQYTFDNSLQSDIVSQPDVTRLQNDIPIQSIALTDAGNAALLSDNLYGYNNLSGALLSNLSAQVQNKVTDTCPIPLVDVSLYAYLGRPADNNLYYSQVGYYDGEDTTIRFGSLSPGPSTTAQFNINDSKEFGLDFADKKALRCYFKGTPFYEDGIWYQINSDFSQVEITEPLDFGNTDTLTYINNVFTSGGFFVCKFILKVPAGRYLATIGRHNVPSSGDYRNTSTYIMGIANSRAGGPQGNTYTIIPQTALVSYSKEMEIDCTTGNVDVWGNNADLFYIGVPYQPTQGNLNFRFIEGYLQESPSSPLGVELFPYQLNIGTNFGGTYTDKNGFYFAFIKQHNADTANVEVDCKLNCTYPFHFEIPTNQAGYGWKINGTAYVSDHNGGVFGPCNRVLYIGKITSLDGTIGYSNVAISIKDGATVYTQSDGTFILVIHNGLPTARSSNVYVNAGGNFLLTIADCGFVPLFNYNENIVGCTNCNARTYPIPLNLAVNAQGGTEYSLKENGSYSIGGIGADLAGRLGFVNVIIGLTVPSFLQTGVVQPTFFELLINGALNLPPWMAWFAPCVSNLLGILNYLDWIADSMAYVDSNGNVVSDQSSATFISLTITSLYNNNLGKNFTLLSNYQFTQGDRLRLMDDGNGNLLTVATYGEPIDVQILGTNYNQAAMTAGLIPNSSPTPIINNNISNNVTTNVTAASGSATVTTLQTTENATAITLYVKYDSRFNQFIKNTGLWIELYTPEQVIQEVNYNELQWYAVNNGEIGIFEGFNNGQPVWNYPTIININFWDTYLFSRSINIPGVGNQFFSHPFQSPNISDSFGYHITSGGRQNVKNDDAEQKWDLLDSIKSDNYDSVSSMGTFRSSNRKSFNEGYTWGGIVGTYTQGSVIIFVCEHNWFVTNFNFQYIFANAQGVQVANLDNQLSEPMQKIGAGHGCAYENTSSLLFYDRFAFWYDSRNEGYVLCDYRTSNDISAIMVKSYFKMKTKFITSWNQTAPNSKLIDVISGVDGETGNIYVTFRYRNNNSNNSLSYINNKRNVQTNASETIVYNILQQRWKRFTGFCPESYGVLKGYQSGLQLISFAAGVPYIHNTASTSFSQYFGVQVTPVLIGIFNKPGTIQSILQTISIDSLPYCLFLSMVYSEEKNSFSYIPVNLFTKKSNQFYASVLRNMHSYKNPDPEQLFRSTLQDGKRITDSYYVCRFEMDYNHLGEYTQLDGIYYSWIPAFPNKK